jgi:hypothetical protein
MRHTLTLSTVAISAFLATTAPTFAQTIIQGSDVEAIVNIARGHGAANLETDAVGDPFIRGRIDGVIYVVNFYGCTNGQDCTTIQFRGAWAPTGSVTLESLNDWNRDIRFGKAYLDAEGAPTIEWDVNLFGGVTATNLDDTFDWWKIILTKFANEAL